MCKERSPPICRLRSPSTHSFEFPYPKLTGGPATLRFRLLAVAPHLEKWRHAEGFRAALKGVNAVVAGAILGVGLILLPPAIQDRWAAGLFLVALLAIIRWKVPAVWIVVGGLMAGGCRLLLLG